MTPNQSKSFSSTDRTESLAKAVPLAEELRSVPVDAKLRIDTPNALGCMDTRSIPVGRLCHEAAAINAELLEALRSIERITRVKGLTDAERKSALRDLGEFARAALKKATA